MKVKCSRCQQLEAIIHPSVAGCRHCVEIALCNSCLAALETQEQKDLKAWAAVHIELRRPRTNETIH